MYRQGARNLVLLSRSGPKSEPARELGITLEKASVYVNTPISDISDYDSTRSVMILVAENMPPLNDCIQASMALDVSPGVLQKYLQKPRTDKTPVTEPLLREVRPRILPVCL